MTNDSNETPGTPAYFAEQLAEMQEAGEQATRKQTEWLSQFLSAGSGNGVSGMNLGSLGPLGAATFKTRVQSSGRISIPDVERDALGIEEGDIVQTVVVPIKQSGDSDE